MSEPQPETPPAPAADSETQRIDSLETKVDRILDMLTGKQDTPAEPEPVADVKTETQRAVAEVKRREAAKAAREKEKAANESRLAAIESKLVEKPPQEYRKVTNFMRWRTEADK